MRNTSKERLIATSVLIAFEDGPAFFRIPRGATLAEVSENLDKIGKKHKGQPLSIEVRFRAPTKGSGRGRAAAHPLKSSSMSRRGAPDYLAAQPEYSSWLHRRW
jgi:hypothetical protein